MGRGNIYYLTKRKDQDISFSERDYYDELDKLQLDYVEDQIGPAAEVPLEYFRKYMKKLGAEIVPGDGDSLAFGFIFSEVEELKKNYFKPKLEKLKKKVDELTLENVINTAPDLDHICNDEFSDLIVLDVVAYDKQLTVDDFIRELEPNATYYVYHNVIYMH